MMATEDDPRVKVAAALFEAWSSGDADAPAKYMAPDAVLYDIVGGEHVGWPKIRQFFADGVEKWPDLALIPDEYWVNENGVALRWVMTATVTDDTFGPEAKGKVWRSEGMTWLVFDGETVVREVDYHDRGAVPISLGLQPGR
jgi:steroid delta-isomerase-like uncharacterized protein